MDLLVIFLPQLHVQLLIQILEKDYLYEQLYDGLKMEGAIIFTEFDFSEFEFSKTKFQ